MTLTELKHSLSKSKPPETLPPALKALWWDAKKDWDRAHKLVMDEGGRDSAWVHAYLHRAEGDEANAGYWYRQARRPMGTGGLKAEWTVIARELLAKEAS